MIESIATIPAETAKSRLNNEATHIELIPAKIILREFKIIKEYRLSIILIKILRRVLSYNLIPWVKILRHNYPSKLSIY